MAHFAEIDSQHQVLRVVVISNADLLDNNGIENEEIGKTTCQTIFGGGTWVQTSYNNKFRHKYASIGDTYDAARDAFITPQPFPSSVLGDDNQWHAPVPYPNDGNVYWWDEDELTWQPVKQINESP